MLSVLGKSDFLKGAIICRSGDAYSCFYST